MKILVLIGSVLLKGQLVLANYQCPIMDEGQYVCGGANGETQLIRVSKGQFEGGRQAIQLMVGASAPSQIPCGGEGIDIGVCTHFQRSQSANEHNDCEKMMPAQRMQILIESQSSEKYLKCKIRMNVVSLSTNSILQFSNVNYSISDVKKNGFQMAVEYSSIAPDQKIKESHNLYCVR